ncbi:MAG TPA: flagellar basal body-associated FliL family protein [Chloroflexota bacterium]|nr:flagellar basal body-associated FliL family protein [Chloroflexota bacterium]
MRLPRGSIIGIAAGVGAAVVVVGAFIIGSAVGGGKAAANEANTGREGKAAAPATMAPGPMFQMKETVVNLSDQGGRRYLKIALSVEFTANADEFRKANAEERKAKQAEFDKKLAPQQPLIEDTIITVLASRTTTDVASPEGKQQLKADLKDSLNRALGGDQVANIYFSQFVTQ